MNHDQSPKHVCSTELRAYGSAIRVSYVLTGNCGPNAFNVFGQAGVNVVVGVTGCARKAVERFKAGGFTSASAANVQSHFGMRFPGPQAQASNVDLSGSPMGTPSMRMGRGAGMGGGRGMGRGKGMGFGMGWSPWVGSQGSRSMHGAGESFHINQRIPEPAGQDVDRPASQERRPDAGAATSRRVRKAVALVRVEQCTGCGICTDVCPTGAIRMDQKAAVDPGLCTACAACVSECPNEAIIIVQHRV
jgi:ferredoxin